MVDFRRHPHVLKYKVRIAGGDSVQNEEGDWVTPEGTEETIEFPCRAVPNSEAKTISGEDGKKTQYDFLVYAPAEVAPIPDQTLVEVYKKGVKIISGRAKGMFVGGQLNSKLEIWV